MQGVQYHHCGLHNVAVTDDWLTTDRHQLGLVVAGARCYGLIDGDFTVLSAVRVPGLLDKRFTRATVQVTSNPI